MDCSSWKAVINKIKRNESAGVCEERVAALSYRLHLASLKMLSWETLNLEAKTTLGVLDVHGCVQVCLVMKIVAWLHAGIWTTKLAYEQPRTYFCLAHISCLISWQGLPLSGTFRSLSPEWVREKQESAGMKAVSILFLSIKLGTHFASFLSSAKLVAWLLVCWATAVMPTPKAQRNRVKKLGKLFHLLLSLSLRQSKVLLVTHCCHAIVDLRATRATALTPKNSSPSLHKSCYTAL